MTYAIVHRKDGKRQGWCILNNHGQPINDLYFADRKSAEGYKDRLVRLFGDGNPAENEPE